MTQPIKILEPQALEVELQGSDELFLVAFLKRNERFAEQAEALRGFCDAHGGEVRCYLYDSDYLETAMARFLVKGTPTFLLFHNGREVDRLIGEADNNLLGSFLRDHLQP